MKHNSWHSSLVAIALLVTGVLGCSKLGASGPTTAPAGNNNNPAKDVQTSPTDIAGDYAIVGTNEDGSAYRGGLKIIKHGDVFQFRWDAGKQYDGVGVQKGNVVAVAFTGGRNGEGCGVVSYQLLAGGALDGNWGYWGHDEMGTEKATRTSGSDLAGDYNVTGKNPNGNGYKAELSIKPKAGGYQFAWSNNTSGFGIKQGNTVSVGIGGSRCAFVAYEIQPGGMLDGVWGGYGSSKTGTEKATKK
ncbi:MAG TPA: hypothetical protein VGO73_07980 [Pyrinomonadaceae bacterium]|jgi:hypothetical protein|nr:hypothetical protein [Pyrinomonadaceae bacterium]